MRGTLRGRGVHAVVRLRLALAHLPPCRTSEFVPRSAPCLPLPAANYVRPPTIAGGASIRPLRHRPWPLIQPAVISPRNSNLTPGITRRPTRLMYMRGSVSAVGCMPLLGFAPGYSELPPKPSSYRISTTSARLPVPLISSAISGV